MGRPAVIDSPARPADDHHSDNQAVRGQRILALLGAFGHQAHEALVEQVGDGAVVGNAQVLTVCELALHGSLRPKELMAVAGLTSGGMTKVLDHLEELGLIERAYGQVGGDRRGISVSLTPDGRDTAERMAAAIETRIDAVRALSNQLTELLEQ
jgi:DNA-binding MarR family transcriptional regulator